MLKREMSVCQPDWGAWSRASVEMMKARNRAFVERFGLAGAPYQWDLDTAVITFQPKGHVVTGQITVIGSVSHVAGTFLWSWANEAIPQHARTRIEEVRRFGEANDLGLLIEPVWPGGRAEGLEMLAVAARILEAEGAWVEDCGDVTLFFALFWLRTIGPA